MVLFEQEMVESIVRLAGAAFAGMVIGLNRDLQNKPVGLRTLGLVSLGSALVVLSCIGYGSPHHYEDAVSRVIQGILTGIGFLGAGVILHDKSSMKIHGLTTASTVWIAAMLGIAAGLGAWLILVVGTIIALVLLVAGLPLEAWLERLITGASRSSEKREDD